MAKRLNKKLISAAKVVIPLVIGLYLTWHFYNAMDEPTKDIFFNAIREADYFWIILSMALGFASHLIRAYRWKFMLEPIGYTPKFWHRYHAMMIGYLVNLIIPRAGEATRPALLYQTDKIPFSKSFGTIIAERMFDLVMLGIIFLATIVLSFDDLMAVKDIIVAGAPEEGSTAQDSSWLLYTIISVFVVGLAILGIIWFKFEKFRLKVINFIKEVSNGVFAILKSKNPIQFIFYTIMVWALYLLFFGICFKAFDNTQNFPISGVLIGFMAGTFGLMFTNGGIGAYPYLVGIVVIYFIGDQFDSKEQAEGIGKALGMIIWLSQTVMMIILGLISLVLLPRNYKSERNDKVGTDQA